MGKGLQLLFFGQLRALELEHLYERAFYALTESFLVLTVFKDEFKMQFSLFFSILLFLRVFHWIISDRVDLIFQTAQPASWLTHARLTSAILIFDVIDICLIRYCVMHILANGNGTLVLFAFEFVLLNNSMMMAAGRYILNLIEAFYLHLHQDEDNWEAKSFWTFVVETSCDSTRLLTYVAFFFVILKPYGLPPLHILRDVYVTIMSLFTKINDFIKARRAQAAMDKEILDASEDDLTRDNVCIICREDMSIGNHTSHRQVPKKLPCRHVIHYGCLKSWLERSQRCPTCRRSVITGNFDVINRDDPVNANINFNDPNAVINRLEFDAFGNHRIVGPVQIPEQNPDQNPEQNPEPIPEPIPERNRRHEWPYYPDSPPLNAVNVNVDVDAHANADAGVNTDAAGASARDAFPDHIPQFNFHTQYPLEPERHNGIPTVAGANLGNGIGGLGTEDMILQRHVEFPAGLQLPKGWGVLSAKDIGGIRQVQTTPGQWAVVLPAPTGFRSTFQEETDGSSSNINS